MFEWLGNCVSYELMGLEKGDKLADALQFFVMDTVKILVLVSFIMFTVAFFRSRIDNDRVKNYIESKPKWLGYLIAVGLGAVTPFCSCSSIPLFIGFIEAGIPFGIVMAFLITSPMINEVAVPILGMSVGWGITISYVITGMLVGVLGSMLLEKMGMAKYVQSHISVTTCKCNSNNYNNHEHSSCCSKTIETSCESATKYNSKLKKQFDFAYQYTKETMSQITPYIIVAIALGSWIHGYVPEEFFLEHVGKDNLFAVPMAVILGIPLYTDAVGVVPVVEVLLSKSVPVGTVMAMMMSVVAISLPELIILRKVLKARLIIVFVLLMFISFNLVGFIFNSIF